MAKIKRNMRTIRKIHEGDRYTFKNGKAKVPGCLYRGKPMYITIEEFEAFLKEEKECSDH